MQNKKVKIYNKIVRDNIPELLKNKGVEYKIKTCTEYNAIFYLISKIKEEADELEQVIQYNTTIDELVDLQEIIIAISRKLGYTMDAVEKRRLIKEKERGGFEKNIILLETRE